MIIKYHSEKCEMDVPLANKIICLLTDYHISCKIILTYVSQHTWMWRDRYLWTHVDVEGQIFMGKRGCGGIFTGWDIYDCPECYDVYS